MVERFFAAPDEEGNFTNRWKRCLRNKFLRAEFRVCSVNAAA